MNAWKECSREANAKHECKRREEERPMVQPASRHAETTSGRSVKAEQSRFRRCLARMWRVGVVRRFTPG
jgi:hypothetical protein